MPKLNTILSQLLVGAFLLKSSAGFLPATTTQNSFKLTWELGVEECIRNSVENGLSEYESGEPYMVAVAGIPGSGKSTGAEILADRLKNVGGMHMPFDGYHYSLATLKSLPKSEELIYRRGAPDTFDRQGLLKDLERIRFGDESHIPLPGFDHAIGDPEVGAHVFDREQHKVVICEGLYLLHNKEGWEDVKNCFDLTIFVDAPIDVCMERLKFRNKILPGYTPEEIDIRVDAVDRINALCVDQSKYRADLIVKSAVHE